MENLCDCGNEVFLDLETCEECSEGMRCIICDQSYVKCYYTQCSSKSLKRKNKAKTYSLIHPLIIPENQIKPKVRKQNSVGDLDHTVNDD